MSRGAGEPCLRCKGLLQAALLQHGQQWEEAQRPNLPQLTPPGPPAQTAAACPWAGGTWSERSGLLLNRAPQRGRLLRKYLDWEKLLNWQRGEAKAMAKDGHSGAGFGPAVGPDLPVWMVAKGKALP